MNENERWVGLRGWARGGTVPVSNIMFGICRRSVLKAMFLLESVLQHVKRSVRNPIKEEGLVTVSQWLAVEPNASQGLFSLPATG